MRCEIVEEHNGLTYEIRNIVRVAEELIKNGREVYWENIGDPVAKGEKIPVWMKEILKETIDNDVSFAYSPTKGVYETRKYLADKVNKRGGVQISPEDIIFFNGLGDAIGRCYSSIREDARVIMPEPTYSTHFLAEVLHASLPANTYRMVPQDNWHPDMNELEQKLSSNTSIVGILVINPDNPTGFVYPEETLRQIVAIARKYDVFLLFDEIYNNIIYNGHKTVPLSDIIGDVPGISMKGISKEYPWPGARCGWIEIYNGDKQPAFKKFIDAVLSHKMAEVCSTTLPQMVIPRMMEQPMYGSYLEERIKHYEKLSNIAYNVLKKVPYLIVNRTNGAFYMSVVFKDGVLNGRQMLEIDNDTIKSYVESITSGNIELDKRFVYYMLGSTGVCVVPLTSFFTHTPGFRMTLLEKNVDRFEQTVKKLADSIVKYVESSK